MVLQSVQLFNKERNEKEFYCFISYCHAVLVLASCSGAKRLLSDCPDCPECPEIDCPTPLGGEVPFEAAWAAQAMLTALLKPSAIGMRKMMAWLKPTV